VAGVGGVPLCDQRGSPFTRVLDGDGAGGTRIDMDAFELQSIAPALPGDCNQNNVVDSADYVLYGLRLNRAKGRQTCYTGGSFSLRSPMDGNGS
jgi:hypothetical protein